MLLAVERINKLKKIKQISKRNQYISFDLFDTLIRRKHINVFEVHDTVSSYALSITGLREGESPSNLTLTRYNTCSFLKVNPRSPMQEPTLHDIWTAIITSRADDLSNVKSIVDQIVEFERSLEIANLEAIAGAVETLSELKRQGKTLLAISDMYFDERTIRSILRNCGIEHFFSYVFVSAEVNLTKQTGDLFRHACAKVGIQPGELMHVGDNLTSDVTMAQSVGVTAVHIDQASEISIRRSNFGVRPNVHEDIADTVKLHLFSIFLKALNDGSEHIYFMGRDGCTFSRALEKWDSPIFNALFGHIPYSDVFITRATSCWGNINFDGDWLDQALGNVFLLRGGMAHPRQMAEVLGIDEVPPGLEDRAYHAGRDTALLVAAFRDAGLGDKIKESILRKRELLGRYLKDVGFFRHRKLALCDVGYSGSVPRDLNLYFLQEGGSVGDIPPPQMTLHLLATNSHFENNRLAAKPHVEFSETAVMPAAALPEMLLGSMAWLEVFFKHPSLGPVRRLVEKDGRIEPEFAPLQGTEVPQVSNAVIDALEQRESDIVLLYWAAQRFWWPQFIGPLVNRFSNPDVALLEQLKGNNYEDDTAIGGFRPILHVAPDSSPQEIERVCRQKDYWISGSIEASKAARLQAEASDPATSAALKAGRPSRLLGLLMKGLDATIPKSFDPDFYRDHNPDLRVFSSNRDLWQHYQKHGRHEGRAPSLAVMRERLEATYGALPPDFHPAIYLRVNPDLQAHLTSETEALEHYFRHGRAEGRPYKVRYDALEAELEDMFGNGELSLSSKEAQRRKDGTPLLEIVLARADLVPGPWVELIQPTEFSALNAAWCGTPSTRAACIVALANHDLDAAPALSLDARFDPDFYRRRVPQLHSASVAGLYRHWLVVGNNSGEAPSEAFALKRLTGRSDFPESFDWKGYAATLPQPFRKKHPERYEILAEFLSSAGLERLGFVRGPGASHFAEFIGHRTAAAGRLEEAIAIFERAIQLGGPVGQLMHLVGDLMNLQGRGDAALDAFMAAAHAENPNRWCFINAANLALQQGDYVKAAQMADLGKAIWKSTKPWRRIHAAAYNGWIEGRLSAIADQARRDQASPFPASRTFVGQCAERIRQDTPLLSCLANAVGPLVILTGRPLSTRASALAAQSGISVFDATTEGLALFERALVGASRVIFHEVRLTEETLRLALIAQGIGLRTVFWVGDLVSFEGYALANMVWDDQPDTRSRLGLAPGPHDLLIGQHCDEVVTSAAGFLPLLHHALEGKRISLLPLRDRIATSRYSADCRVLLMCSDARVSELQCQAVASALADRMTKHANLHLVLDAPVASGSPLAAFGTRVRHANLEADLSNAIALVSEVDGALQLTPGDALGFAFWAEALLAKRPALLVTAQGEPSLSRARGVAAAEPSEKRVLTANTGEIKTALDDLLASLGTPAEADIRWLTSPNSTPDKDAGAAFLPASKPKVLLVNLFSPPQVSGGAARVLKDNLDHFLDHHSEEFEFAVFSADDENEVRGECMIDSYRGVPILRIATPQENDMYWRGFNAEVGGRFGQILESFKPDIVHIHCLQLLSAAVAEKCSEKGVPYMLTLHDEWLLSDFHFLIDEMGTPRPARNDLFLQPHSPRLGLERSISRGRRLREVLERAERRMAVSEACAQIYRDCGIACDVVENGVSRIISSPRIPASNGKVRLCHVGGFEYHKGAYLLETALRQGRFDNLTLTIVDLARQHGDVSHAIWGTTPIEIIGRIPHQDMGEFYSRMDVLITPSTCPETYGLATREALAHGLWVIASDRGANGDAVSQENGFVVDVGTPQGLARTLTQIDANAAHYLKSPPSAMPMRTVNDQSRELIEIYRAVIRSG